MSPINYDASYVTKGLAKNSDGRTQYTKGLNCDLWQDLYAIYDECGRPPLVKIKSHMTQEQYVASRATKDDLIANEVADKVADKAASKMQGYRNIDTIKRDNGIYNLTKRIARRISIIESHCWSTHDSKRAAVQRPKQSRKKKR